MPFFYQAKQPSRNRAKKIVLPARRAGAHAASGAIIDNSANIDLSAGAGPPAANFLTRPRT